MTYQLPSEWDCLGQIAQEMGTPAYVYSADIFLSNLKKLQRGLADLDTLVCFAMKSNSNLSIIKLLADAGAGMDVVSGGELYRAKVAGVRPNRIVFSGVGKTLVDMKAGLEMGGEGIYSFNIESKAELLMLNQVAMDMGRVAPVALRFNPDVDAKTHPYISTGIKRDKFGIDKAELNNLIRMLDKLSRIKLKGISVHIGSQMLDLGPLDEAFSKLAELIGPLQLEFVDVGGGLGVYYSIGDNPPSTESYCALIRKHFGASKLKILLEPGRQLSANAGVLLTRVLYRKQKSANDFLVVDASMSELIRPALYGSYHEIVPLKAELCTGPTKRTHVVGPVCESADFLGKNRALSKQIGPGDTLAVLSTGAYGFTMASHYNSRPNPPEVLIENGAFRVIRRRESYKDILLDESQYI